MLLAARCPFHVNRFVRQAAFEALAALCELTSSSDLLSNTISGSRQQLIAEALKIGLADNWTQVSEMGY